nr:DUF3329 domain-containing protein [uncultured Cohaesibacter sp.]
MFDTSHPMFKPLWVRLMICIVTLAWGGFEFFMGSVTWAVIFAVTGLICVYLLLLEYEPPVEEKADGEEAS